MTGILVRDEAARERLRAQVGDIGLILYVLRPEMRGVADRNLTQDALREQRPRIQRRKQMS